MFLLQIQMKKKLVHYMKVHIVFWTVTSFRL